MNFFSDRLEFREWDVNDAAFLFALNADEEVIQFTGDPPFKSVAQAEEFILAYEHYQEFGYGRWLCLLKSTGEPIGWCGLKNQMESHGFIDLGYRFLKSEWGNGYATEAAQKCLEIGFTQLAMKEITGRTAVENHASARVLEKIGMTKRKTDLCHGLPAHIYSITTLEFEKISTAE